MIDIHCHLNFKAFEKDIDKVIKRAFEAGVTKIINVGTKIDSSQKAIELAEKHDNLYATVGVHPHHADKLEDNWEEKLEQLAKHPKVVAIGECGMDFHSYQSNNMVNPNLQKELFIKQIELAYKLKLPLQIHNRQAGKEILDILLNHQSSLLNLPGVFHCFSGDKNFLKKVLNLGFYIGFDGNITYKGMPKGETTKLEELVKFTPLDRILTETDAPFLSPQPYRGGRNLPEYVILIARKIAEIKGVTFEEVKKQTTINTKSVFKLN